jgi:hypothetical protein
VTSFDSSWEAEVLDDSFSVGVCVGKAVELCWVQMELFFCTHLKTALINSNHIKGFKESRVLWLLMDRLYFWNMLAVLLFEDCLIENWHFS